MEKGAPKMIKGMEELPRAWVAHRIVVPKVKQECTTVTHAAMPPPQLPLLGLHGSTCGAVAMMAASGRGSGMPKEVPPLGLLLPEAAASPCLMCEPALA